jgi:hypothetical protein
MDEPTPMQVASGRLTALNISAAAVVKTGPSRVARVSVVTAGSAAGGVYDCNVTTTTEGFVEPAAGNKIATIPNAVGVYVLDWPCSLGIVVVPGSEQVLSVSYS